MQKHKSYPLTLLNGTTSSVKQRIDLERGTVIGGFITVANPNDVPASGFLNIGLETSSGTDLVDEVDVKAWAQRQGGSYTDSIKPFFIKEITIYVVVNSDVAPANDVKMQLVLVYDVTEKCD